MNEKLSNNKKNRIMAAIKKQSVSYFMLSFWLILFIVFTILPILSSLFLSFTNFNMLQPPKFIGLDNYLRLFLEDDIFLIALKNTILFAVITGPIGYILSFIVAWFINDVGKKMRSFFTLMFYSPTLAGNIYFVWLFIFSGDSYGVINGFLIRFGLISEPIQWLADPKYNLWVIIIVVLWLSMGAGFLSFVAGFKQLNNSLFEAAAIDGITNRWQELYYITLPQMVPQLLIGAVLSISGAFAIGYQSSALTGFPSTDYSTHTVVLHILDYGYFRFEMGYASAIALVLFLLMISVWGVIQKFLNKLSGN